MMQDDANSAKACEENLFFSMVHFKLVSGSRQFDKMITTYFAQVALVLNHWQNQLNLTAQKLIKINALTRYFIQNAIFIFLHYITH